MFPASSLIGYVNSYVWFPLANPPKVVSPEIVMFYSPSREYVICDTAAFAVKFKGMLLVLYVLFFGDVASITNAWVKLTVSDPHSPKHLDKSTLYGQT